MQENEVFRFLTWVFYDPMMRVSYYAVCSESGSGTGAVVYARKDLMLLSARF